MRSTLLFTSLLLLACNDTPDAPQETPEDPGQAGTGGTKGSGIGDPLPEGAGAAGAPDTGKPPVEGEGGAPSTPGEIGPAHQLVPGGASLVGVTSNGFALYRDADGLNAAEIAEKGAVVLVSETPGSVVVKGPVVFNWANMDWEANRGDLSIWSEKLGTEEVGSTLFSEVLIAASPKGDAVVYTANTEDGSTDLVVASDGSREVLIESMGLASDETCGASVGFVGSRLFVGWCEEGSRVARLDRFERDDDEWKRTTVAKETLPAWSSDAEGERIFFQSSAYEGYYAEGGDTFRIDGSVSRGVMLPDGSAVLYTVGDQLRRAALPDPVPVPVVTVGYANPVGFTPDYRHALYSSKVTYEGGTKRDLHLVPTEGYTPAPIALVTEPIATLPRSSMTKDGKFFLYLTDVTPEGGDLHVVDLDGNEVMVLPNVLEAAASRGSTVVFTDRPSDPDVYPVVADLKVVDLAVGEPELIEGRILDGRNFKLDATGERVVYVRSGVDRDPEDPESEGVFWRTLP